jgi:hypothetical protein
VLVEPVEGQHFLVGLHRGVVPLLLQALVGEAQEPLDRPHGVGALRLVLHLVHCDQAPRVEVEEDGCGLELGAPQLQADGGHGLAGARQAEHLPVEGVRHSLGLPLHLERDLHGGKDRPDALPLVDPPDPLQDHRGDRGLEGDEDVLREVALLELEGPPRPEEEVVDRLFRLGLQGLAQVLLAEDAVRHEDGADEAPLLLLGEQGLEELLLGDEPEADQELAERLPGIVGPGGEDEPLPHDDPLLDRAALDLEGPRLLPHRDPLKDVGQRHGLEVALEAHWALGPGVRTDPGRRPRADSRASSRGHGGDPG